MTNVFLQLSKLLTGFDDLNKKLAEQYFERLRSATYVEGIDELLSRFTAAGANAAAVRAILDDAELRPVAEQVIFIWYTSATREHETWQFGPAEHYFQSLMWDAVQSHPPALSGGYFGYWMYPPEN